MARSDAIFADMSTPRIPVVITDKNNRVTTVYRKAHSDQRAASLPTPSLGMNPAAYLDPTALDAMRRLGMAPTSDYGLRNISYIAKHDQTLLESIVGLCESDADEKRLWLVQLRNYDVEDMDDPDAIKNHRWRFELQRTAIKVMALIDPGYTGHFPTDNLLENVHLANHQRPVDDWEYQHARVIAIGVEGEQSRRGTEAFDDDVEFISKNREAVESVLPELAERRTVESAVVKALLSNPSPALRDGTL